MNPNDTLREDLNSAVEINTPTPQYVDRANNPDKYPHIQNEDGSISTHRMATEVDENGDWASFPTIVQMPDGSLKQFEDPFEAMRYNRSIGNTKEFGVDKEAAINYGKGGYKPQALIDYGNQGAKVND